MRRLAIGAASALLLLLGFVILWLTAGGLLESARDHVQLALLSLQALALLGVTCMAARHAGGKGNPRWLWATLCAAEMLATAASWMMMTQRDAAQALFASLPALCAAVLAGLSAWTDTPNDNETEESTDEQEA